MRPSVAIDLGTVNTLVYTLSRGLVIDEPSVVAVERSSGRVLAVGKSADALCGREPEDVDVIKPLHDGVIADLDACTLLLKGFLHRVFPHYRPGRPGALVCVPGGATDVERRALVEATEFGNPRFRVGLVHEAIAAALGSGVVANGNDAIFIVDIGGGTTEMAVVVGGRIVRSRSVRVAGNEMDAAIIRAVRSGCGIVIGERTAEHLKMAVGLTNRGAAAVTGVDLAKWGWLRTVEVAPGLVAGALRQPVDAIIRALRDLLSEVPPDLAEDILDGGIHLAGGGALLHGLPDRIAERTCCQATVVQDPLRCVMRGLAVSLGHRAQDGLAA